MFDIDMNGKITITKGDSGESELFLNCGTVENPVMYELLDTDEIHFYAYPKASNYLKDSFIHKVFKKADVTAEGLVAIKFHPGDTSIVKPGEYLYRVRLIKDINTIDTIIDENTFVIRG